MLLFGSHGAWQGHERLGQEARRAVQRAEAYAATRGLRRATPDVLLLALLEEADGVPVHALTALGVAVDEVRALLCDRLTGGTPLQGRAALDAAAREGVILGVNEARRAGFEQAGAGHVLLGVLEARTGRGARLLARRGADLGDLRLLVHELEQAASADGAAVFGATFASLLDRIGGADACPCCRAALHVSFRFCYNCGAATSEELDRERHI